MTEALAEDTLAVLAALAVTLVPADETPGADEAWARAFVVRQVEARPAQAHWMSELASELDAAAQRLFSRSFVALSVEERESVVRAGYPTVAADPMLEEPERERRRVMRELMIGFLASDHLDIYDPIYQLTPLALRDQRTPSDGAHAAANVLSDLSMDRTLAMSVGTGDYARVWRAAGHEPPPGMPRPAPTLVTLERKKKR